jgi:uncharacterized membrane-anchored protein
MSARLKTAVLAALSVAQLGAAAWSIARYETILSSGTPFKILTAPVDPADAFRGRYVAVRPSITIAPPITAEMKALLDSIRYDSQKAYVRLAADPEGFARPAGIVLEEPRDGDYLKIAGTSAVWTPRSDDPGKSDLTAYTLQFSFDRYYMNEAAAPEAERRYAQAAPRRAASRAWLAVRVKNGIAVIEGLFIDGVAIEAIVRR